MADPNMSFEEGDNGTMVVKMKMVFNDITKYGSISLVEEKMTRQIVIIFAFTICRFWRF